MLLKRLLCGLLLCLPGISQGKSFCYGQSLKLYSEFLHTSQPASAYKDKYLTLGDIYFVYQGSLDGEDASTLPTQASVESAMDAAAAASATKVVFDIEVWPTTTQANRTDTASKFAQVAAWAKARQPSIAVGFYSYSPIRDYFRALALADRCCNNTASCSNTCTGAAAYAEWQGYNDDVDFSSSVDFLVPNIYIFYPETSPYTNTLEYVEENIHEAQRLCASTTCEVIPILSWYHAAGTGQGDISAISTDNPAKVTTADTHELVTGTQVTLSNMIGADEIEFKTLTITVIDNNEFTLDGVDGAAITAYTSGGEYYGHLTPGLHRAILDKLEDMGITQAIEWGGASETWANGTANSAQWWKTLREFSLCQRG